ncbi:thioredoxin [Candidatus Woesearchaeota archaeon]|nr:thioredoxin [Candidatus Woesearchaeota archaeon]
MQEITDSTFEKEVLNSDKPVVLDAWAPWCAPCLGMAPIFEELSKEMKNVKFVKMNVDENQETPSKYFVQSIPTFLIFKNGKLIANIVGGRPKSVFKSEIEKAL